MYIKAIELPITDLQITKLQKNSTILSELKRFLGPEFQFF